jgi:methylmalonyl-CoA/ethylmalonyl-CoA epimerase
MARQVPAELRAVVQGLHHVAVAVPSIDAARALWVDVLGFAAGEREHVADQGVNVLVLRAGGQRVELVEPARPGSPIERFLEQRGAGLHHLAWKVADLERALSELARAGVRLIDERPRPGAHGTRIAFVHPSATGGVLMELVEEPK